MRQIQRQVQRAVTATAVIVVAVAFFHPAGVSAAPTADTVYESAATAFGPLTASGNCSGSNANQLPSRQLADTLDDAWFDSTGYDQLSRGLFPDADAGSISPAGSEYLLDMPGTSVTIGLTYMSVPNGSGSPGNVPWDSDLRESTSNGSWGEPATAGDPTLLYNTQERMQDCSVKPLSLVSPSEGGSYAGNADGALYWNAAAFGGSAERTSSDSVLIRFSEPVDNFGAWFGDLETRTDGHGQPAYIKLYDIDGDVVSVERVEPATPRAITSPGVSDVAGPGEAGFDDEGFGCGDQHQSNNEAPAPNDVGDYSACGNHGTRFLGFTRAARDVGYMQVIVGDDDHCVEVADQCDSNTEHLSLIGPTIAVGSPQPPTTTTTTTTTTAPALVPDRFGPTGDVTGTGNGNGAANGAGARAGADIGAGTTTPASELALTGPEVTVPCLVGLAMVMLGVALQIRCAGRQRRGC